jgi:O-acetyl-ADP-ribose deacetylase (regulator of RNase III)
MKIQLVDINPHVTEAWEHAFKDVEKVSVHCCDLFELPTKCVVSAANSFGFMDGGVDAVISNKIPGIQKLVQERIQKLPNKELLVGETELVYTDFPEVEYCLVAPTMRRPAVISNTVNVYLAAKSIFTLLKEKEVYKDLQVITIPGLGTSTGRVSPDASASQMRIAYNHVHDGFKFPKSWQEVRIKENQMFTKYEH